MATSKAHCTCHCMSQLSDSPNLLTLSSCQPISDQLSHEHNMIETEHPTTKRQRKRSLLSILFQISLYVIDLINFDLNYLNNYWHLILKSYICQLCTPHTTFLNLKFKFKFFKSINFCKNGKQKCQIQIYCHNYVILCNLLKQPSNPATRGHFTKQYKYPQNSGKLHHLVKFFMALKAVSV